MSTLPPISPRSANTSANVTPIGSPTNGRNAAAKYRRRAERDASIAVEVRSKRYVSPFHTLKLDGEAAYEPPSEFEPEETLDSLLEQRAAACRQERLLAAQLSNERPKRSCRENISNAILSKVEETASVEGRLTLRDNPRFQAITKHEGLSWEDKYTTRCKVSSSTRQAARDKELFAIKNYKPVMFDMSWLSVPVVQLDVVPETWKPIWNRNLLCNVCNQAATPGVGRLQCHTCPVVQHVSCTFEFAEQVPDQWLCSECVEHLELTVKENAAKVQRRERAEAQLKAAMHLQRSLRMYVQYRYYKKLTRVLKSMQGHTRGYLSRIHWARKFSRPP